MILHLAWKFVCKLSSSWLLIPQNLLIFSSQLMNNCSDWELFGNNLSCKKTRKKNNIYWRKKNTHIELRGSLLMKRKVIVWDIFILSYCCTCDCLLQKIYALDSLEMAPPHFKKNKETKKPKSFGFAIMLPFKSDLFYFIKRF